MLLEMVYGYQEFHAMILTFMKYFFKSPSGDPTVMQPVCVQADEPYDSAERTTEPGGNTGQISTCGYHIG